MILHELRQEQQQLNDAIRKLQSDFNEQYKPLFDARSDVMNRITEIEASVRDEAIKTYNETGDKQPMPGVTVKMFTKIDYDRGKAFDWAKEHKIALMLDTKAFDSLCKTASKPEFVEVKEEPKAMIATDLSKVIPVEAEK
jgi:hypothetical protein